jgi:hypothetical protein
VSTVNAEKEKHVENISKARNIVIVNAKSKK